MTQQLTKDYILEEPASAMAAIRTIRKRQGHTSQTLADLIGGHQTHVSHLEVGQRLPALETLFRLAHALGYDVALIPRGDA